MDVGARIAGILRRVEASAQRSGRSPHEITVVAVCKRQPLERILEAHDRGIRDFGESTAKGLVTNAEALAHEGRVARWHFVGRLQRNKAKFVARHAALVHSVDRLELAQALSARAQGRGEPLDVLVQVNTGRESQKGGVDADETLALARTVASQAGLRVRGLMTIPPAVEDPREHFEALCRLGEQLRADPGGAPAKALSIDLSMGMTGDFETAIECGATLVRIGTGIFGERQRC